MSLSHTKALILGALSQLLDFLLWIFWGEAASGLQAGQCAESPLSVEAVPGLTTLLDIALFRSVEAELTGTTHTSHALLQVLLQMQKQARRVLHFLKTKQQHQHLNQPPNPSEATARRAQLESFARVCYDASCDLMERMSTDRFAQTANLSDPYHHHHQPLGSESTRSAAANLDGGNSSHHESGSFLLTALHDSLWDTGRRRLPVQQRPRDCWETARLHCPDYVWGHDVCVRVEKVWRSVLLKHPYCAAAAVSEPWQWLGAATKEPTNNNNDNPTTLSSFLTQTLEREEATVLLQLVLVDLPCRLSQFKAALEAESVVSKRLYLVKSEYRAPLRAFWEAHSSVQRAPSLELVKDKLSSASSSASTAAAATAPSGGRRKAGSAETTSSVVNTSSSAKDKLQKLLDRPELVKLLAMERKMEEYELDMALALYPFCELARYLLDQQKRVPKTTEALAVRETLWRLKHLLLVSSTSSTFATAASTNFPPRGSQHQRGGGSSTAASAAADTNAIPSAGIRPLLLDLQGILRDDEEEEDDDGAWVILTKANDAATTSSATTDLKDPETMEAIDTRLDALVTDIKFLAKLCSSEKQMKRAFVYESSNKKGAAVEMDHPPMAAQCRKFDGELFRAHFKDWYNMAVRQHEIASETVALPVPTTVTPPTPESPLKQKSSQQQQQQPMEVVVPKLEQFAEEVRRAEMAVSLSLVATEPASLRKIKERVELITQDRLKRFDILKESLEDLCLREMDWHIQLLAPPVEQALELRHTGDFASDVPAVAGFFGIPLLRAKQILPLG